MTTSPALSPFDPILQQRFIDLISDIYRCKYVFHGDLAHFHHILGSFPEIEKREILAIPPVGQDRKNIFISDYYQHIDRDSRFSDCYQEFILSVVKPLFPEEEYIVYQTTPNLRISLPGSTAIGRTPNDTEDFIGIHCDGDFGHSHDEVNFIVPITDMFETNSLYYQKEVGSKAPYEEYPNLILHKNQYFRAPLSQLVHYNCVNTTQQTRMSLDFRVIPYSKYVDPESIHPITRSLSAKKRLILGEYFSLI